MTLFKRGAKILAKSEKCCDEKGGACIPITEFSYAGDPTYILTLEGCGNPYQVDLSGILSAGEEITSVTYNPITNELIITTNLNTYIVPLSAPMIVANAVFVMENGVDTTGTRERMDLPFATPWAAVAAAQAGDTVYVLPGTYALIAGLDTGTQYLAKNGVVIHMYEDSKIIYEATAASATNPLYDQGSNITFKITGNGYLEIRKLSDQRMQYGGSDYDITLDTFLTYRRWYSTNTTKLRFRAKSTTTEFGQLYSIRNTINRDSDVDIEIKHLTAALGQAGANTTWSITDARNITKDGKYRLVIHKQTYYNTYPTTGLHYTAYLYGDRTIKVLDHDFQGSPTYNSFFKLLYKSHGTGGDHQVEFLNFSHIGNLFQIPAVASSIQSTGYMKFQGIYTTPAAATAPIRPNIQGFNTDSRVVLELDLYVTDNFDKYLLDLTKSDVRCKVKGYIKHNTSAPATNFPLNYDDQAPSANPCALLHDLLVESQANYLMGGTGPAVVNIPCKGVVVNAVLGALNPALHNPVIEPPIYTNFLNA